MAEAHVFSTATVHGIIKNAIDSAIKNAPTFPDADVTNFKGYVSATMTFLHAHHHHEDLYCFPLYRNAQQVPYEISKFEDDHKDLIGLMTDVEKLVAPAAATIDRVLLVEKLEKIKSMLYPHLDLEENIITKEFLWSNFDEAQVEKTDKDIKAEAMKGDGTIVLPLMRYNMSPEAVEKWWNVQFPFILRYVVFPLFLSRSHAGYWKYAAYAPK
ncbi:hypothetical protein HDU97_007045 [Phlyctochytrium planicorne]|nr:hypothetical protein HDU97_007045 [Phlyctochytrium planicorne]